MESIHTLTEVRPHTGATVSPTLTTLMNDELKVRLTKVVKGADDERTYLGTEIRLTTTQWREVIETVVLMLDSAHLADEDGWLSLYTLNEQLDK